MSFVLLARSPVFPYPYSTAGVSSIDRPLMNTPNLSYAQQSNALVSPMALQQQQHSHQQQPRSPAFPSNLSTNQDTTLPHVCQHTF